MQWIKNVFELFYPNICFGCDDVLQNQNDVLCDNCLFALNFVPISVSGENEMKRRFYGKLLVEHCMATMYFTQDGIAQKLLHHLKYHQQPKISNYFATLTLQHIKNHEILNWADLIVPVPLHPSKEKKRGYNQLDGFGLELSKKNGIPYCKDYLLKTTNTKSQTHKNISERATTKNIYVINERYTHIKNKRILLIDDVMTTGSTLETIGNCILNNSTNKLSILTMAYTR